MTVDFSMIAGTNRELQFAVKDANFVAVDVTSADIVWVAALTSTGAAVITKSTDQMTEIEITNGPAGEFSVYLLPDDTDDNGGVTFYHEARTILAAIEEVVFQGTFSVTDTLTYGAMP
jgi:hypothetical protein